ncbi:MAG TPA: acetate/propionate family kinase [Candidatus Binataceae bacterium]|nr:acetate/propionate family kinase [Candidatus Binataceae bacterium]
MRVLVFNCGSSSLKFELIEVERGARGQTRLRGLVESIGTQAKYTYWLGADVASRGEVTQHTHEAAATHALHWMRSLEGDYLNELGAAVHRIVHGGSAITQPAIADDTVLGAIEKASIFAPLHNPPALATIRAVSRILTGVPEVVIADTAFHQSLPPRAWTYAIPKEIADRHGIRRFGFHGIGHAYMMERYAQISARSAQELNLITLQLGAGCSITAIAKGLSVDTSMGLTPLEGLMMATRSGDIDPAIPGFLAAREGLSSDAVEQILNTKSGLQGVSAISSDMREVQSAAARGDRNAALAIDVFCYRVRKYIGSYLAVLGRADAIIFGGGIGEHSDQVRERICAGLDGFGIQLDSESNRHGNAGESRISGPEARVEVWVIPLDEELYMARAAARLLDAGGG